jgi:hypothetical protein
MMRACIYMTIAIYTEVYLKLINDVKALIKCRDIIKSEDTSNPDYSTIRLNCTCACENLDENYQYNDYHMLLFRLNRYHFKSDLDNTLKRLTNNPKIAEFHIFRDSNKTLTTFQLWWKCFRKHNSHLRSRFNFVFKFRLNNWLGFTIRDTADFYNIYHMQMSTRSGHIVVKQPTMYQNREARYVRLFEFILDLFNMEQNEVEEYTNLYSFRKTYMCKDHKNKFYNTILTIYQNPNISEKLNIINTKSNDNTTTEGNIYSYNNHSTIDIINYGQLTTQAENEWKTQRASDYLSEIFILTFLCSMVAYFYPICI